MLSIAQNRHATNNKYFVLSLRNFIFAGRF
nr:MAG TPA: hypothetical protein [Caudoviricetes sp.]